jgi:hypothetical protein
MKTSPSKAEQIRKILTDTPSIPSKQVAEMTGFPLSMVYQVKYNMNKKNKKPVGRPRKAKTTITREEVTSNAIRKLEAECGLYRDRMNYLTHEVSKLEREIVGFRAVISYLEHRLGLESSQ